MTLRDGIINEGVTAERVTRRSLTTTDKGSSPCSTVHAPSKGVSSLPKRVVGAPCTTSAGGCIGIRTFTRRRCGEPAPTMTALSHISPWVGATNITTRQKQTILKHLDAPLADAPNPRSSADSAGCTISVGEYTVTPKQAEHSKRLVGPCVVSKAVSNWETGDRVTAARTINSGMHMDPQRRFNRCAHTAPSIKHFPGQGDGHRNTPVSSVAKLLSSGRTTMLIRTNNSTIRGTLSRWTWTTISRCAFPATSHSTRKGAARGGDPR